MLNKVLLLLFFFQIKSTYWFCFVY